MSALMHRAYRWLLESAVTRHDDVARWLDYVGDSGRTFVLVAVVAGALAGAVASWGTLLLLGIAVLFRRVGITPSVTTIVLWEANVWLNVVVVVGTLAAVALAQDSLDVLVRWAVRVVVLILVMYLMVDLIKPPRRRKRVRVPARALARQGGTA